MLASSQTCILGMVLFYEPSYPLFFKTNWIRTNKNIKIEIKDEKDRLSDLAGALTTITLILKESSD